MRKQKVYYFLSSIIINLLILSPIIYTSSFAPIHADDFIFYNINPFYSIIQNYLDWGGAYTSMFFSPLLINTPIPLIYKIIIFCIYFSLCLSVALMTINLLWNIKLSYVLLLNVLLQSVFWLLHPDISSAFFIVNWFVAYTFSLGLILLISYLICVISVNKNANIYHIITAIILSFVVCGDSLIVVAPFFMFLIGWVIFAYKNHLKNRHYLLLILAWSFIFITINVLAPGNFARAKFAGAAVPIADRIETGFLGYLSYTLRLLIDKRFLIFLAIAILLPIKLKLKNPIWILYSYLYVLLAILFDAILCIPTGESSSRLVNFAYYEILMFTIITLILLYNYIKQYYIRVAISCIITFIIVFIPSYKRHMEIWAWIPTFAEQFVSQKDLLPQFSRDYQQRIMHINSASFTGYVNTINVPVIISAGVPLLNNKCEHWLNYSMAKFYNVKKICLINPGTYGDNIVYLSKNEYLDLLNYLCPFLDKIKFIAHKTYICT